MRPLRLFVMLVLFFMAGSAFAQISMTLEINQQYFLQYEPVFVRISMKNLSAHALAFGETEALKGAIRFEIQPDGQNMPKVPLKSEEVKPSMIGTILPPGAVVDLTFCLTNYYDLRPIGRYKVKAVLSHPQMRSAYESNPLQFIISQGSKVWGPMKVGIPEYIAQAEAKDGKSATSANNGDEVIRTRSYSVVSYFTGKVTAYALVIDDEEKNYLVRRIGYDLGVELRPRCEVDFLSRINIIVAASPKVYAFYRYNLDGKLEHKQVFIKTTTTPTLVLDPKTGIVMPVGGREARLDVDYTEIKDLPFTEAIPGRRMPDQQDQETDDKLDD